MEIINNDALLERFLSEKQIAGWFGRCEPKFLLLRYRPGELLTTPFTPSPYLHFIIKGDILLYDMPNEDSTVSLQTSHQEIRMIGDLELLDVNFVPFFVEAKSEVVTAALFLDQYRDELLKDPVFLQHVCRDLAAKLRGATEVSMHIGLKDRLSAYVDRLGPDAEIKGVARLAEQLNVSERQLIRVLRAFCEEGRLLREKAGVYRVLRTPGKERNASQP